MESIFSLPYSEYEAIGRFSRILKKRDGYSIFIPVSRQQQGCDFLIVGPRSRRTVRVQVKSSRGYQAKESPQHHFLFRNLAPRYRSGDADLYAFTCHYPIYATGHSVRDPRRFWETTILVFTDEEIARLLPRIRSKSGKADSFFTFGFDNEKKVMFTRGSLNGEPVTSYLLRNRVKELKGMLG